MNEEKDTKDIEQLVEDQAMAGDAEGTEEEKALAEEGTLDERKSKARGLGVGGGIRIRG